MPCLNTHWHRHLAVPYGGRQDAPLESKYNQTPAHIPTPYSPFSESGPPRTKPLQVLASNSTLLNTTDTNPPLPIRLLDVRKRDCSKPKHVTLNQRQRYAADL
jgi:hypothetical protein